MIGYERRRAERFYGVNNTAVTATAFEATRDNT
jgi:hypothetical protein